MGLLWPSLENTVSQPIEIFLNTTEMKDNICSTKITMIVAQTKFRE